MRLFLIFLLGLTRQAGISAQNDRLFVTPIAPGIWVHTSYQNGFPSNGLIVEDTDHVLIVDTGWGKRPTRKLLRWVRRNLGKPVRALFVTHWHEDRTGGLSVFQKKKIPIRMSARTAAVLQQKKGRAPAYDPLPDDGGGSLGHVRFRCFYPGPGHTADNMVVYFEDARLLAGGCFVKSLEATTLGFTGDAELGNWPASMRRLQARFPGVRTVLPGHQAWGGPELLQHTLDLLAKNGYP